MNIYYTKTLLYTYRCIDTLCAETDKLMQDTALNSINDYSPAFDQCLAIVNLSFNKERYLEIKKTVEKILPKLSKSELELLDYKYFRRHGESYYKDFDFKSREYFRKQKILARKICKLFEETSVTDEYFEREYLPIGFIKVLLKRVVERERMYATVKKKETEKPDMSAVIKNSKKTVSA